MPRPTHIPEKSLLLVIGALVTGCNDTAYPTIPTYEEPAGPYYTVSGVISDSLTGEGIPGARVYAGKRTTLTDPAGLWFIDVPDGVVSVSSTVNNYDGGHETITVHSPVWLNLTLRRRAPLVVDCSRDSTMAYAVLIDLQGRKTIERWNLSKAVIEAPSGNITLMGQQWSYFPPPDYYHWPIGFAIPAGATRIKWEVYDIDGYRFLGSCEFTSTPD